MKTNKVGLALSSGGARCLAHIGVIKVLNENKIPIDYISGTSMGAVIGAYYALYLETGTMEKVALSFQKKIDMFKIFDMNDLRVSIIKGEKVKKFLEPYFKDKTFADTKIPLAIGATALEDGSMVVFKTGKILDAIMASIALPSILPAVEYNGKHLVDGALAEAIPIDMVLDMGADIIIGVDLFDLQSPKKRQYKTIVDTVERTYEIIMSRLSYYKTRDKNKNILFLKPKATEGMQILDFYNSANIIKIGEVETKDHINEIKKLIK